MSPLSEASRRACSCIRSRSNRNRFICPSYFALSFASTTPSFLRMTATDCAAAAFATLGSSVPSTSCTTGVGGEMPGVAPTANERSTG